jgi:hypothetical protein
VSFVASGILPLRPARQTDHGWDSMGVFLEV